MYDRLPASVQFFASAMSLNPQLWCDMNAVRDMFEKGHRSTFIDTTIAHIKSLHNILAVCQLRLLSTSEFPERSDDADRFPLDGVQLGIVNAVMNALEGRDRYYNS